MDEFIFHSKNEKPAMGKTSANKSINEYSKGKIREHSPDYAGVVPSRFAAFDNAKLFTAPFEQPDLYVRSLNSETDYKGVSKCLYGEGGWSWGMKMSFDFGMFVTMTTGLGVNIQPGAKVKGSKGQQLMLLVHRAFPNKLLSLGTDPNEKPLLPWISNRPVCFMTMRGDEAEIDISVFLNTAFGLQAPVFSMDGHGLAINIAEAGFSGGFKYKVYVFDLEPMVDMANIL